MAFFGFVLLLGGGGAPGIGLHSLIGAISIAWAAFAIWIGINERGFPRQARPILYAIVAVTAWFALQFVPLPYSLWSSLPGRALAARQLSGVGLSPAFMPFSLYPEGTWMAFMSILPGFAAALTTCLLSKSERDRVLVLLIAIGILTAVLGALQAANPQTPALYIHQKTYFDLPSGIFANRNFQGLYLLVVVLLATAYLRRSDARRHLTRLHAGAPPPVIAALIAIPLCSLMALATLSRFAAAMLLPVLALAALSTFQLPKKWRGLTLAAPVAIALAVFMIAQTSLGEAVTARFREGGARSVYWPALAEVARTYLPLGSGFGTFDKVFRPGEPLALLEPNYLNHAHNDYFELLIEGGAPAAFAALAVVVWFVILAVRAWRRGAGGSVSWTHRLFTAAILLVAAHSFVDYPLRTATMLAAFTFMLVSVVVPALGAQGSQAAAKARERSPSARIATGLGLGAAALLTAGVALLEGLSAMAVDRGIGGIAASLSPFDADASVQLSRDRLLAGKLRESEAAALSAVRHSPLDAEAVRLVASSRDAIRPGSGTTAWLAAGLLGWRDSPTQLWYLMHGVAAGNARTTMIRAEALARLDKARDEVAMLMRLLAREPANRADLVAALEKNPAWRPLFLSQQYKIAPFQLDTMVEVVRALARSESPPTVEEARPVLYALLEAQRLPQAYQLHRQLFDGQSANRLSNGSFERKGIGSTVQSNATPFDWLMSDAGQSGAAITRTAQDSGMVLDAYADGRSEGRIASQVVSLTPGRYDFHFRVRVKDRDAMRYLRWSIGCSAGGPSAFTTPTMDLEPDRWVTLRYRVTSSANCPGQIVELRAAPDAPGEKAASFDDITLVAAK